MYSINPEEHLNKLKPINEDKSINRIEREHEMKIQDEKLNNELEEKRWRSCCFQLEPESSVFFGKLSVSLAVVGLCAYQLITLKDCNYQSLYSSLLSSVITFWLSKK